MLEIPRRLPTCAQQKTLLASRLTGDQHPMSCAGFLLINKLHSCASPSVLCCFCKTQSHVQCPRTVGAKSPGPPESEEAGSRQCWSMQWGVREGPIGFAGFQSSGGRGGGGGGLRRLCLGWRLGEVVRFYDGGSQQVSVGGRLGQNAISCPSHRPGGEFCSFVL